MDPAGNEHSYLIGVALRAMNVWPMYNSLLLCSGIEALTTEHMTIVSGCEQDILHFVRTNYQLSTNTYTINRVFLFSSQ